MNNFAKENWDKIIAAFCAIILAGVVGYFSAVLAIKSELSTVRQELVKVETELEGIKKDLKENNEKLFELEKEKIKILVDLALVKKSQADIKQHADISMRTNNLLLVLTEEIRHKSINEIRDLLKTAQVTTPPMKSPQPENGG